MLVRSTVRSRVVRGVRGTLTALLLLALAPVARGWATDIVVTTTVDEENSDGDCSLREAIRAANLNQARDACPAGSATERDTVTLASGAAYSLTIPGSTDQAGLAGDLDIVNNVNAPSDLLINVADGGTATISQDANPDDFVFEVFPNVNLEIDDVTIRGGNAAGGLNGGGISIGNGATVTLERCALLDNVASNNGGAISVGSNAVLVMDGCVVTGNVADGSGGGIFTSTGSVTTISDTVFQDNVATQQSGGAIRNTGQLTVTASSFVDNRASNTGGAVVNSASAAGSVSITGSCLVGNNDVGVDSFVNTSLVATGNWWGASDGPSGTGSGGGDSVGAAYDFTGFVSAPPAGCRPQELVANGGFELDDDADLLPDRWRTRKLVAGDGLSCNAGECVATVAGGQTKQLIQTIDVPGHAGDGFKFSASSAATGVPATGGRYLIELLLIHTDGSRQRRAIKFSPGDHSAEQRSKALVASADYVRLKVRIQYGRASGTATFDDVSVSLE